MTTPTVRAAPTTVPVTVTRSRLATTPAENAVVARSPWAPTPCYRPPPPPSPPPETHVRPPPPPLGPPPASATTGPSTTRQPPRPPVPPPELGVGDLPAQIWLIAIYLDGNGLDYNMLLFVHGALVMARLRRIWPLPE